MLTIVATLFVMLTINEAPNLKLRSYNDRPHQSRQVADKLNEEDGGSLEEMEEEEVSHSFFTSNF